MGTIIMGREIICLVEYLFANGRGPMLGFVRCCISEFQSIAIWNRSYDRKVLHKILLQIMTNRLVS